MADVYYCFGLRSLRGAVLETGIISFMMSLGWRDYIFAVI